MMNKGQWQSDYDDCGLGNGEKKSVEEWEMESKCLQNLFSCGDAICAF